MIAIHELSMSFGTKLLFYEANLTFNDNTRYALLGANGAGKTTFFKLLTSEEEPASGEVSIPKSHRVGFLKQDQFSFENTPLVDVVIHGKPELAAALTERDAILNATEWDENQVHRLGELEDIILHQEGYSANAFAEKLLMGLGIESPYHYQPLKCLSGGYKLRVLLAQALFEQPELLLLDEPTNHLDIISIRWLEKYLKNEFSGTLIFISHDMEFVNRLADHIIDIDYGEIRQYSGNYQKFLEEKKLIEEQKCILKKSLEDKISEMQKFVDRFKAKASKARQAQSRMKMIEKIELPDIKHSSRIAPHFQFIPNRPSGKTVLKIKNLSKSFSEKKLFQNINIDIGRGEKVAILGENGVGKSTLIKIIIDQLAPDTGQFEWGYETKFSYFSQDHHETLNTSQTVLNWLQEKMSDQPDQRIRKTLGQVLFTKEEVEKNILNISGGEAARLLLAKMMLESTNVLILDEPTNHLDLESTEALSKSLKNYAGTVIFVSHNRHFVNAFANRIVFLTKERGLIDFRGNYCEFEKAFPFS